MAQYAAAAAGGKIAGILANLSSLQPRLREVGQSGAAVFSVTVIEFSYAAAPTRAIRQ
ncbi:hypothetical protein KCP75_15440 [Salmonella enterica subsp. enterica]|nr:hypothetical protein KCP75_15440 [Salmonella enterica subsp. enterica]